MRAAVFSLFFIAPVLGFACVELDEAKAELEAVLEQDSEQGFWEVFDHDDLVEGLKFDGVSYKSSTEFYVENRSGERRTGKVLSEVECDGTVGLNLEFDR